MSLIFNMFESYNKIIMNIPTISQSLPFQKNTPFLFHAIDTNKIHCQGIHLDSKITFISKGLAP